MAKLINNIFAFIFLSVFFSVITLVIFSSAAYAGIGKAKTLTKEDVERLEKLTFYENTGQNLIGTSPVGKDYKDVSAYSFAENTRIVNTNEGRVTAEYGHVGRFHDRDISVVITFSDFAKKSDFGERDGSYICIPYRFRSNFHYDGDSVRQKFVFYYSDDPSRTPIDMSDAFICINGLNMDEYAAIDNNKQVYLSENSQLSYRPLGSLNCYGNGPQGYSDGAVPDNEKRTFRLNGVYYEEDINNPLYYVASVLFCLDGTENTLYIEDKRRSGGFGIEWSLDLTTLHVTYNIRTSVVNGSITPDISGIIYNTDRKITYSPNPDHVLDSVTVDGTPVDTAAFPDSYEFKNITKDHEIAVVYKLPYRKISTEAVNGTITPDDENLLFGSDKKIEYSPNEGYVLDSITVDEGIIPALEHKKEYLFSNVRSDHHIKVVYTKPDPPVKKALDENGDFINGKFVRAGDIITYEISYKNPLSRQADITISDKLPAGTEYVSSTENGVFSDGGVVWKIRAEPLSEGSVRMKVRVLSEKNKTISNYAMMTFEGINLMSNTVENPLPPDPVKSVHDKEGKDINETFIQKDQEISYHISFKNTASSEKDIRITDHLPEGMNFISADNNGSVKNGDVVWELHLKPGEERKVEFKVKALQEGKTYINQAAVKVDGISVSSNKVENWVPEKPKKEVKQNGISVDGKDIPDGETVTFYITVKNTSSKKADIRIEDNFMEALEITGISDGGNNNNNLVTWTLKDVPAGSSKTVDLQARVKGSSSSQKITNTAYMTISDMKYPTNEVGFNIPMVTKLEVLGKRMEPVEVKAKPNAGVLGERKVPTGDSSNIMVLLLIALCSFAGIMIVRLNNVQR